MGRTTGRGGRRESAANIDKARGGVGKDTKKQDAFGKLRVTRFSRNVNLHRVMKMRRMLIGKFQR